MFYVSVWILYDLHFSNVELCLYIMSKNKHEKRTQYNSGIVEYLNTLNWHRSIYVWEVAKFKLNWIELNWMVRHQTYLCHCASILVAIFLNIYRIMLILSVFLISKLICLFCFRLHLFITQIKYDIILHKSETIASTIQNTFTSNR